MAETLRGKRVAILAADGVERVELEQPREALDRVGARTDLLSVHGGEIQAGDNDLAAAGTFTVDGLVTDAFVTDYDALPGKEDEVMAFLDTGRALVDQEPATIAWFGIRLGPSTFGIFDVFPDDAGRDAHLSGRSRQPLASSPARCSPNPRSTIST
ncbi:MAG: peptidase [Marmoricola sp.]|nr:peptidase [Marmoricola sp.]